MSVIFVDIETTDLGLNSHILQIAAKCGISEFNVHVMPGNRSIHPKASAVNGFTRDASSLYYYGREVGTLSPLEAISQFVSFVRNSDTEYRSVLVSHNANFDAPRLLKLANCFDVYDDLAEATVGYADSLSLIRQVIPGLESYSLGDLVKTYLPDDYFNLHNALGDVRALNELVDCLELSNSDFLNIAAPFDDYF